MIALANGMYLDRAPTSPSCIVHPDVIVLSLSRYTAILFTAPPIGIMAGRPVMASMRAVAVDIGTLPDVEQSIVVVVTILSMCFARGYIKAQHTNFHTQNIVHLPAIARDPSHFFAG